LDPKTFELLQKQDWDTIGRELVGFAVFWARNYHWRHGGPWELAAGETVEDIVQKVIVKTIEGKRNWDPHKGPLVPWLRDQVRSEIDHLCYSRAHRYEVPIPKSEDGEELTDVLVDYASQQDTFGDTLVQDPEQIILRKEAIQRGEDALFQAAGGDPELEEVLINAFANYDPKPQHLAAAIGVPVEDIYNRLRRLRRRAMKLLRGENS
jgi:DNA-directed RNA polymerase specialized sigma24 family protein